MKLRVFFCCLALFAALIPTAGWSADPYPIKRMLIVVDPGAKIGITGIGVFRQRYVNYECLGFKNKAAQAVTKIVFAFVYYDAKREYIGQDLMERTGSFSQGGGEEQPLLYQGQDFSRYRNCLAFNFPKQGIAFTVLNVRRVEYADGATAGLGVYRRLGVR